MPKKKGSTWNPASGQVVRIKAGEKKSWQHGTVLFQRIGRKREGERPCLVSLHTDGKLIEVVPTLLDRVGLDPTNEMRAWEQRLEKEESLRQRAPLLKKRFSILRSSPFAVTETNKKEEDKSWRNHPILRDLPDIVIDGVEKKNPRRRIRAERNRHRALSQVMNRLGISPVRRKRNIRTPWTKNSFVAGRPLALHRHHFDPSTLY